MPQLNQIVLADGETVPVNHTFSWNGREGDDTFYKESGTSLIGNNSFSVGARMNATDRFSRQKLIMPVVVEETINGVLVPRVQSINMIEMKCRFSLLTTEAIRKNMITMFWNSLDPAQTGLRAVHVLGENVWA